MKATRLQKILWSAVAVVAIGAVALIWVTRDATPSVGASAPNAEMLSADFELTDHRGMIRTDEDFRNKWMLVFFGFTNCPDICPMGLATIARVMDDLGPRDAEVQPLFITVDPERDTPSALAEYVPQFGPGIIGLTGSPSQIERTARTFKIYYQKIEDASAPDGYTMGHTSAILLFDPEGEFARLYDYNADPEVILAELEDRIGA